MSFGIGKAFANPIHNFLWHQVAIPKPEFVVIAQRQCPAAARTQLSKLREEVLQRAHFPVCDGGE